MILRPGLVLVFSLEPPDVSKNENHAFINHYCSFHRVQVQNSIRCGTQIRCKESKIETGLFLKIPPVNEIMIITIARITTK